MKLTKFLIYGLCNFFLVHSFDIPPTGVAPDHTPLYTGTKFECFDKSKTISFDQVNDDYCDCQDSSDEPGTSACPNSRFYCLNKDYVPKYISGNFVNDHVCDCCDGSDEYVTGNCTNTCLSLAASLNAKKTELHDSFEQGHRIYREFVEDVDIVLTAKKEETRKKLEEQARVRREQEIQRRKDEAERKAEEAKVKAEEELKKASSDAEESKENIEDKNIHNDEFDPEKEAERLILDDSEPDNDREEEKFQETTPEKTSESKEETDTHEDVQIEPVTVPDIDYGPKNAFLMLASKDPVECLELAVDEYIYKLCPFENVYQRSKNGGSETLLGSWSKWLVREHVGSQPVVMLYDKGQGCWQGPTRSAQISITCGKENKITDASEPSRCEYHLKMESPAACYLPPKALLDNLQLSHDEL